MKLHIIIFVFILSAASSGFGQSQKSVHFYLNQQPPGLTPKIFAKGLISTETEYEFGSVFSKSLDEFYYAVRLDDEWNAEIRYSKRVDGQWTEPRRFPLDDRYSYNDPFLSDDESRLYFMSNRPINEDGEVKDSDLWYTKRTTDGWSEPINLGKPVNSEKDEYYVSFSENGTIYYASNMHTSDADKSNHDIYASSYENSSYQTPVRLNEAINSKYFEVDAYVSPDESYLIFCSTRPDGFGAGDLYISFKDEDDNWSEAVNMGDTINTRHHEFCPFVTKDGRFLFYTSNGDVYWVSSKIIDQLKKQALKI